MNGFYYIKRILDRIYRIIRIIFSFHQFPDESDEIESLPLCLKSHTLFFSSFAF